jgi:hypothetical protein
LVLDKDASPPKEPRYYGTRLSTILLVKKDGSVVFIERDIWKLVDGKPSLAAPTSQRTFRFELAVYRHVCLIILLIVILIHYICTYVGMYVTNAWTVGDSRRLEGIMYYSKLSNYVLYLLVTFCLCIIYRV